MENNQFVEQGITREIRFAVVMYGGVSLAIYINGIAQELLKMCRGSVAERKTVDLKGTEKIYRQISALMANEKLIEHVAQLLTQIEQPNETSEAAAGKEKIEKEIETILEDITAPDDRPLTKFVVDVLIGTSAGGINAIFLAKALANNQDITQLKDLWLNEGDIKVLINDKMSVEKTGLSAPDAAKSLLNSQRMYLKLLEAFEAMGKDSTQESIYTTEIDLFVPITDFRGAVVPLRLLDDVVEEKRFGQVFQFRYEAGKVNDFNNNNPMLAFAARVTSSFPFAFEPMRLSQAYSVIEEGFEDWKTKKENLEEKSKQFFPKIIKRNCETIDWIERDLIDGGVLDNKPFGYAIDVLAKRRADFLCERKLLYIEPSPENYSRTKSKNDNDAPNVIQNAVACLSSIPGYETIREDLEQLLERNKLIGRVTEIISKSEKDVFEYLMKNPDAGYFLPNGGSVWENFGLEDIVKWKGLAVLPYYRLRIADVTDEIGRLVARIIGVEEDSENFLVIRDFVKTWRDANYSFYKNGEQPETVLSFLRRFDLKYRLRRLRFVQEKATLLYRFQKEFRADLEIRKNDFENIVTVETADQRGVVEEIKKSANLAEENDVKVKQEHPFVERNLEVSQSFIDEYESSASNKTRKTENRETIKKRPSEIIWLVSQQTEGEREIGIQKIRLTVNYFIARLRRTFKKLQDAREKLFDKQNQLSNSLSAINLPPENLKEVFDYFSGKSNESRAEIASNDNVNRRLKTKFPEIFQKVEKAAGELETELDKSFRISREEIKKLLKIYDQIPDELSGKGIELDLVNAVQGFLSHYYENFDAYDQLSFPIFYETQVGEAVKVDVMRISPQDATDLIDERRERRQKLAGESLFHFGAFLDRVWRFNDIMWGRLDGVERLITALLPDEKYKNLRKYLAKKAHLEVLREELLASNQSEVQNHLLKSLIEKSAGVETRAENAVVAGEFTDEKVQERVDNLLQNCFDPESAYQFIKKHHTVENRLDPKELLRVISRSTKVTGDIFEGIAEKDSRIGSNMRWISRLGTIFWGLVEVSTPNSFWNLFFQHWLMLIYFFEIVLLAGSTLFVKPEIQQFATVSLILTLIIHLTAVTLQDFMRGGRFWDLIRFVAVGVFTILTIAGGIFIYSFFYDDDLWKVFADLQNKFIRQERYLKLFPVALLITIFAAMLTWRETANVRVRFFGAVSIIFAVTAVIFGVIFGLLTKDASGINNLGAILSLEFARNSGEVMVIAGELGSAARSSLKWALAIDSFLFIPFYTGFLLIFSRLFNLRKWELKKYLMFAAAFTIIGTALADLSENLFTYSVLETQIGDLQQWKINGIWISASVKWFLLSAATAILSLIFWRKSWWTFFTVGFTFASVCGIAGLFDHQFIQRFMLLQISLLLAVGLLFLIFPGKFRREF